MTYHAPNGLSVGHIHLKVADLDRSIAFYRDVLGLELRQRMGDQAAFLSAGGYHHHVALNTWFSKGGTPPTQGMTGLFHAAFLYPTRQHLAEAGQNVVDAGTPLDGASDHGVSEAVYFRDPDGNGIELYVDHPRNQWPQTSQGDLAMVTKRLDISDLLRLAARNKDKSQANNLSHTA